VSLRHIQIGDKSDRIAKGLEMDGRAARNDFTSNRPRIISDDVGSASYFYHVVTHEHNENYRSQDNCEDFPSPTKDGDENKKKKRHRPRGCRGRGSRRNRSMRRAAAQAETTQHSESDGSQSGASVPEIKGNGRCKQGAQGAQGNNCISSSKPSSHTVLTRRDRSLVSCSALVGASVSAELNNGTHADRRRQFYSSNLKPPSPGELSLVASSSASSLSLAIVSSSSSSERSILLSVSTSFEASEGKLDDEQAKSNSDLSCQSSMDHHPGVPRPNMEKDVFHLSQRVKDFKPYSQCARGTIQEVDSLDNSKYIQVFASSPATQTRPREKSSALPQAVPKFKKTPGKPFRNPQHLRHDSTDSKVRKERESGGSLFSTSPKSFLRGEQKKRRTTDRKEMDHILSELQEAKGDEVHPDVQNAADVFGGAPKQYCWF
jgi:hypothetical protein